VVVVRGAEREASEAASLLPVLVGVDGSSNSDASIGFAIEAAAARSVAVVAVRTWSDMVFDPAMPAVMIDWEIVEEAEERQVLAEQVGVRAERRTCWPGVPGAGRLPAVSTPERTAR
jgi:Universal stress protein family